MYMDVLYAGNAGAVTGIIGRNNFLPGLSCM